MRRISLSSAVLAGLVLLMACSGSARRNGDQQAMGKGKAWAWVESDVSGNPLTIGVTMTEGALVGLTESYDAIELPMPDGFEISPYKDVVVGWDPLGHNPAAYAAPHLDFMFFFIDSDELALIKQGPDSVPVESRFRPPDYNGVLAEPTVGVHWGDTLAPELRGKPFGATFVYGFYHGKLTFVEPMAALSFFGNATSFSEAVKQPAAFQQGGYYPTRYAVKYDAKDRTYTVALEGLTLREAAK